MSTVRSASALRGRVGYSPTIGQPTTSGGLCQVAQISSHRSRQISTVVALAILCRRFGAHLSVFANPFPENEVDQSGHHYADIVGDVGAVQRGRKPSFVQ